MVGLRSSERFDDATADEIVYTIESPKRRSRANEIEIKRMRRVQENFETLQSVIRTLGRVYIIEVEYVPRIRDSRTWPL